MLELVAYVLLLGLAILVIAESLPGVYIDGYGTAIVVAIVYGLINLTLGTVFKVLSLPLIVITLGLFLFVINSFLLYLTDALVEDFDIDGYGTTLVAAILITLSDTAIRWIV
ncbi:MAG: phage holin family protein [Gammaproteobacteria bacterium]|nr:phage holin family protein [Gammaproteobacteria bacterium]